MKKYFIAVMFLFLFTSCAPKIKPLTYYQIAKLRQDFEQNCLDRDITPETRTYMIRGWWDLQEIKAFTTEVQKRRFLR